MTVAPVPGELLERSVDLLLELCAVSSASSDVAGLFRMTEILGRELKPLGLLPEVYTEPGVNNGTALPVLTATTPARGERYTLFLGHVDTVLPAVPPKLENGRVVGTGALDMKGGFVAFIGALKLLQERGEAPPENLLLVAVPDEEIGGPVSVRAVRRWGECARTVLVLEPGGCWHDGETLVTGRRGLTVWRLDARGRAAHSGVAYWEGRSALAAAATWAGEVQQLSEEGDGPVVNAGRIVGGDSEFVTDMGEEHRFIGTTERLNIVADRGLVEGEVRYLDLVDRDRLLNAMRDRAEKVGRAWDVEMSFEEVEDIPPMSVSGSGQVLADYLVSIATRDGWRLGLESNRGGVSFPNFLPDPANATIIDGLGPIGGGMHTRDEFLDLESLARRISLVAETLLVARTQGG